MILKTNETEMSQPMNQWVALNRFLFMYKAISAALVGLCLILGVVCIMQTTKSPIVILANDQESFYFQGKKGQVDLKESDIQKFVESFVTRYYNWPELHPEKIIQSIGPLATEGFKENTFTNLKLRREKDFVGKKIKQSVAGVSVKITKESTIASFDVILRIDGIPLIVPTQVAFTLVKGNQTEWNPMGLYVNTLTTHEGR